MHISGYILWVTGCNSSPHNIHVMCNSVITWTVESKTLVMNIPVLICEANIWGLYFIVDCSIKCIMLEPMCTTIYVKKIQKHTSILNPEACFFGTKLENRFPIYYFQHPINSFYVKTICRVPLRGMDDFGIFSEKQKNIRFLKQPFT